MDRGNKITHMSMQRIDVYKTAEMVSDWRVQYQKPIVMDECAYEENCMEPVRKGSLF